MSWFAGRGSQFLRVGFATVVLAAAFVPLITGAVSTGQFMAALGGLIVAQIPSLLSALTQARRTVLLARPRIGMAEALTANALTATFGYILPSRLADGVKPLYLARAAQLPLTRGLSVVAVERFIDICCVALLISLVLTLSTPMLAQEMRTAETLFALIAIGGILAIFSLAVAPRFWTGVLSKFSSGRVRRILIAQLQALRRTTRPRIMVEASFWGILTWLFSLTLFIAYFHFALATLTLSQVLVVFLLGTLGLVVSALPAGLGTFEAAIVLGLTAFGYGVADSISHAVMLRLSNGIVPAAITAGAIARGSFDHRRLMAEIRSIDLRQFLQK